MPAKREHEQRLQKETPAPASAPADDFASFEDESGDSESNNSNSGEEEEEEEMSAETRAELLKGFDSSDSDSDEDEAAQGDEDDRIIELSNLTPSISSALSSKNNKNKKSEESGVLYVGRIPHGFYEEEMTSYFSQFGNILNLRMSRSKKTGRSRHYAFIEFADRGVAEIVAQTMHNYLLASHLLQVVLLTPEEYKKKGGKDLFKGAGKKFKAVPWAQIAKERVESAKTEGQWREVEKREKKRRLVQNQRIKDAGIDYAYESPAQKKIKKTTTAKEEAPKKAIKSKKEGVAIGVDGSRKSSSSRKGSAARKVSVK